MFDEAKTVAGTGFLGPKTLLKKKIKKRLNCSTQKVRKNSDSFLYQKPISFVAHFAFEEFPHEYVIALRGAPNTTHIYFFDKILSCHYNSVSYTFHKAAQHIQAV